MRLFRTRGPQSNQRGIETLFSQMIYCRRFAPQSNQRGIETPVKSPQSLLARPSLNRTSVGLKQILFRDGSKIVIGLNRTSVGLKQKRVA